jgi:DNA-binding NarL/FixJ family response regulator
MVEESSGSIVEMGASPTIPPAGPRVSSVAGFDQLLRRRAEEADTRHGAPADLREVWCALLNGERSILDHFCASRRWFLLLASRSDARALSQQDRVLISRLLLGESQKSAALDVRRSVSSVSTAARRILSALGLDITGRRAPAILTVLAHAGMGMHRQPGRSCALEHGGIVYEIVSVERPELRSRSGMTASELDVMNRLIDGNSYAEIARARQKSVRTVANQIAAVFRRLHVSGRSELISHLVARGQPDVRHVDSSRGNDAAAW